MVRRTNPISPLSCQRRQRGRGRRTNPISSLSSQRGQRGRGRQTNPISPLLSPHCKREPRRRTNPIRPLSCQQWRRRCGCQTNPISALSVLKTRVPAPNEPNWRGRGTCDCGLGIRYATWPQCRNARCQTKPIVATCLPTADEPRHDKRTQFGGLPAEGRGRAERQTKPIPASCPPKADDLRYDKRTQSGGLLTEGRRLAKRQTNPIRAGEAPAIADWGFGTRHGHNVATPDAERTQFQGTACRHRMGRDTTNEPNSDGCSLKAGDCRLRRTNPISAFLSCKQGMPGLDGCLFQPCSVEFC